MTAFELNIVIQIFTSDNDSLALFWSTDDMMIVLKILCIYVLLTEVYKVYKAFCAEMLLS